MITHLTPEERDRAERAEKSLENYLATLTEKPE